MCQHQEDPASLVVARKRSFFWCRLEEAKKSLLAVFLDGRCRSVALWSVFECRSRFEQLEPYSKKSAQLCTKEKRASVSTCLRV